MMTDSAALRAQEQQINAYTGKVLQRFYDNFGEKEKAVLQTSSRRAGERAISEHISRGDVARVRGLLEKMSRLPVEGYVGQMSFNSLRQKRYTVVSAVTLYCRAALDGGLPERLAYGLSDSLIQTMDELEQIDVGAFMGAAMLIFTGAVSRSRFAAEHPALRQCHEYIIAHLGEPIRLSQLAEACGRNPRYLSDLFEKELGIRPAAYIRKCRLEASCLELRYTRVAVAAIAEVYAFPSASAYCAQFKNAYGMTPQQYRKQYASSKRQGELL